MAGGRCGPYSLLLWCALCLVLGQTASVAGSSWNSFNPEPSPSSNDLVKDSENRRSKQDPQTDPGPQTNGHFQTETHPWTDADPLTDVGIDWTDVARDGVDEMPTLLPPVDENPLPVPPLNSDPLTDQEEFLFKEAYIQAGGEGMFGGEADMRQQQAEEMLDVQLQQFERKLDSKQQTLEARSDAGQDKSDTGQQQSQRMKDESLDVEAIYNVKIDASRPHHPPVSRDGQHEAVDANMQSSVPLEPAPSEALSSETPPTPEVSFTLDAPPTLPTSVAGASPTEAPPTPVSPTETPNASREGEQLTQDTKAPSEDGYGEKQESKSGDAGSDSTEADSYKARKISDSDSVLDFKSSDSAESAETRNLGRGSDTNLGGGSDVESENDGEGKDVGEDVGAESGTSDTEVGVGAQSEGGPAGDLDTAVETAVDGSVNDVEVHEVNKTSDSLDSTADATEGAADSADAPKEAAAGTGCGELCDEEEDDHLLTFEEFKKKMKEQEDEQVLQRPPVEDVGTGGAAGKRAALSNYASQDCGAKVVETNPEAKNSIAILKEDRDVYMINPCSANITFVVELCEIVSIRSLEIACFELFSSIPKSFRVYSSESYPDTEWNNRGTFEAPNERKVHSFPLAYEENVYAKFIKVEMLSHYDDEHFCPLSLLRVLGASMMAVYEEAQGGGNGHSPSVVFPPSEGFTEEDAVLTASAIEEGVEDNGTLLGAATDAVLRVLEKPLRFMNLIDDDDDDNDKGSPNSEPSSEESTHKPSPEDTYNLGGSSPPPARSDPVGRAKSDVVGGAKGAGTEMEPTNTHAENAGDLGRCQDGEDQSKNEKLTADCASQRLQKEAQGREAAAAVDAGGGAIDAAVGAASAAGASNILAVGTPVLDKDKSPYSYSSVTAHEPLSYSREEGRSEGVVDLKPMESWTETTPQTSASPPSCVSSAPLESSSVQGSPQAPAFEQLGPSTHTLELDSVHSSSSIPPLGPDLLGPEPVADPNVASMDTKEGGSNEHVTPPSEGTTSDNFPSTADAIPGGDTSELHKPSLTNGNTRDASEDTTGLERQSPTTESSSLTNSSTNGTEQIPQLDNTDVLPQQPPDGVRDGGRGDAPLTTAHPSGMGSGEVRSDRLQADRMNSEQWTDSVPAASPSDGDTVTVSEGNTGPSDLDGSIPANMGATEINGQSDLDTLAEQPLHSSVHLPSNSPSGTENVDSVTGSPELVGPGEVNTPELSTTSKGGGFGNVSGNETGAELRSENGNLTGVDVPGGSGKGGMGANSNQGGVAQNGNDTTPGKNHTMNGGGSNGFPSQQKEKSVFLRLSKHIDELDKNMTLFGIFLDQISSSLKKNKNKTEEVTRGLDRRMTSLNESILSLKREVDVKLTVFTELKEDVLVLMESVSEVSHDLLDLKLEVYAVVIMVAVFQFTILFISLISCAWQCYANHSLRMQLKALKATAHLSLVPPPPLPTKIESLGSSVPENGRIVLPAVDSSVAAKGSRSGSAVSAESASRELRKSLSTSDMQKPSKRIQSKLSRSGGLPDSEGVSPGCWEADSEDSWLTSSSASNLENFTGFAGTSGITSSGVTRRKKHAKPTRKQ